jgi:hypothetical protein
MSSSGCAAAEGSLVWSVGRLAEIWGGGAEDAVEAVDKVDPTLFNGLAQLAGTVLIGSLPGKSGI